MAKRNLKKWRLHDRRVFKIPNQGRRPVGLFNCFNSSYASLVQNNSKEGTTWSCVDNFKIVVDSLIKMGYNVFYVSRETINN